MQCCCLLVVIDLQENVIFANVRKLRGQRGAPVGLSVSAVLWGLWWPLLPPAVPPQPGCALCCRPGASELSLCCGDGGRMARLQCGIVESLTVPGGKEPLGSSSPAPCSVQDHPKSDPMTETIVRTLAAHCAGGNDVV